MTSASAAASTAVALTNSSCSNPYTKNRRAKTPLEFVIGALPLRNPIPTRSTVSCRRSSSNRLISQSVVAKAARDDKEKYQNQENDDNNDIVNGDEEEDRLSSSQQQLSNAASAMIKLDDVNPVGLGRRSRQVFDELWRKFSGLGQISRTTRTDDETSLLINEGGPMCEFAIPGAQNTTVLVVGATSRVGRIVVRKLMLRGYTVKVDFLSLSLWNNNLQAAKQLNIE